MGALTSKVYAFKARPWELKRIYTHDFLEPMATPIAVDIRGAQVMRILPQISKRNEQWISDRVRFFYDGLTKQRLITPMYRKTLSDPFMIISPITALQMLFERPFPIHVIVGGYVDYNRLTFLKEFSLKFGRSSFSLTKPSLSSDLMFQPDLSLIDKLLSSKTAFLILDTSWCLNYPTLEIKLRLISKSTESVCFTFGNDRLGFAQNLGKLSAALLHGKHKIIAKLYEFDNICLIASVATESYSKPILTSLAKSKSFNALVAFTFPETISSIPAAFLNYKNFNSILVKPNDSILLFDADSIHKASASNFIVYAGSHGDLGASSANLILPFSTLFERKDAYTYSFDGNLIKFTLVQPSPIKSGFNKKAIIYNNLFSLQPFPLQVNKIYFIKPEVEQQNKLSLLNNAITRASPSLAVAAERFFQAAIARNNF
jgi:NADH dehydrogenase (ubiquinone) Fe-S protein 1